MMINCNLCSRWQNKGRVKKIERVRGQKKRRKKINKIENKKERKVGKSERDQDEGGLALVVREKESAAL